MDFEDIYSAYFQNRDGIAIFYTCPEQFCPEVAFLSEGCEMDYALQDLSIPEFEILGSKKYPVVILQYDMPMPDDLKPAELIEHVTKETKDRGFRFWVYLLEKQVLQKLMDNFTAHNQDRIGIKRSPDDSENPSMILEGKKGELLTCIFFTKQSLSKHFHTISGSAD